MSTTPNGNGRKSGPLAKERVHGVEVAGWLRTSSKSGEPFGAISVQRSYYDAVTKTWKSTNGFPAKLAKDVANAVKRVGAQLDEVVEQIQAAKVEATNAERANEEPSQEPEPER